MVLVPITRPIEAAESPGPSQGLSEPATEAVSTFLAGARKQALLSKQIVRWGPAERSSCFVPAEQRLLAQPWASEPAYPTLWIQSVWQRHAFRVGPVRRSGDESFMEASDITVNWIAVR